MRFAIVTPTYNEIGNIEILLRQLQNVAAEANPEYFSVFVVDDSSPDGTGKLVKKLSVKLKTNNFDIKLLPRKGKDGLGRAYIYGFNEVLSSSNYDYIIQMDADLSHDPKYIIEFVHQAKLGADFVVASRYIAGGSTPDWPLNRRLLSRAGNLYARLILGSKVSDYTGGYNMYKASLLNRLKLGDIRSVGYGFLIELKFRALQEAHNTQQLPIVFLDRRHGTSKIPRSTIVKNLVLVPILWRKIRAKNKVNTIRKVVTELRQTSSVRAKIIWLVLVLASVAILTSLVYLIRAGSQGVMNWPVNYNLANSDNGVLYQLSQDMFKGHTLDWSFSPQVYVFPEIPISLLAYTLAAGNIYSYFLFVAAINNTLLFALIFMVTRVHWPKHTFWRHMMRAIFAFAPLLFLPLLGVERIFQYHLFPTYYFGVYAMLFLLPLLVTARRRWQVITLGVCYILSAASNPMVLTFTVPAMLIALLIMYLKHGLKATEKPLKVLLPLVLFTVVIRNIFFSSLAGESPAAYISIKSFANRLHTIHTLYSNGFLAKFDHAILIVVALSLVTAVGLWLFYSRRYMTSSAQDEQPSITALYLLALPFAGTTALFFLLVLHEYYLWTSVVGCVIIVGVTLPLSLKLLKLITYFIVVLILFGTLNPKSLHRVVLSNELYYGSRPELTKCIDRNVSDGAIGYAAFSDARHYSLTSASHVRLIQIDSSLAANNWLTNEAYSKELSGTFFVVNPRTEEAPITASSVTKVFGNPIKIISCDEAKLYFYTTPGQQATINNYYQSR